MFAVFKRNGGVCDSADKGQAETGPSALVCIQVVEDANSFTGRKSGAIIFDPDAG